MHMDENAASSRSSPIPSKTRIITFTPSDAEDLRNWSRYRTWPILFVLIVLDTVVGFTTSGYSPAEMSFAKDMNVSTEVSVLGLGLTVLCFAFGAMPLAPLSETYGRNPFYIASWGCACLFLVGTALVPNLGGFLALRFVTGLRASVTIANIGGTIADLYHPHDTGPAMSLFIWAATNGSNTGFLFMSFVAQYRGWRDVFWVLVGISGGLWVIVTATLLLCVETRQDVLLRRKAKAERARTGASEGEINVPEEIG